MAEQKKKTIMIIEDDPFLVKAYRFVFEKEALDIWVAQDGQQAIDMLKKEPPAIVLLDLMLPGVSGFDVLAAIRINENWKNVPVMIISNLGQASDVQKGKDMGAVDYMVKANTDISDIVQRVKHFLTTTPFTQIQA